MKKITLLIYGCLLITPGYTNQVFEPAGQDSLYPDLIVIEADTSYQTVAERSVEETKFFGDYTVNADETVHRKIRVIGGDLTVHGTVIGQIIVVGGDVYLKSTSVIEGRIITLGGTIYKEDGAFISGKTIESNLEGGLIYREVDENEPARDSRFHLKNLAEYNSESWIHPRKSIFQYNRHEGVIFSLSHTIDMSRQFQALLTLGYRSDASDKITGRLTMERHFLENRNLTFYLSFFNESKTDDGYRLPVDENSLAMLLGRQDFYDRWNELGWESGVGIKMHRIKLKASYGQADHDSLIVRNVRSLFEKERPLRPEIPGFTDRKVETLNFTAAFRTASFNPLTNGLALFVNRELFKESGFGEPVYRFDNDVIERTTAAAIVIFSPAPGLTVRTRLMAGMSVNELYSHRKFYVGGLGSVSAHPFKAQGGDMMVLGNIEFFLRPMHKKSDSYLKLFADGGHAWNKADYGFEALQDHIEDAISSYGFGFGSAEISDFEFGINFAFPSKGPKRTETTIRINYTF